MTTILRQQICLLALIILVVHPKILIAETTEELYKSALVSGEKGNCNEAVRLLRKASSIKPQNMEIAISLSTAADCAAGRIAKGPVKKIFKSRRVGEAGDWSTALSLAQEACNLGPKYAPAFLQLGIVYYTLISRGKDHSYDAIDAFSRVIDLEPNNGFAHFYTGLILYSKQNWKDASIYFDKATSYGIEVPSHLLTSSNANASQEETNKKNANKLNFFTSLWPFGPDGFICKYIIPSSRTHLEKNFWGTISGGCKR